MTPEPTVIEMIPLTVVSDIEGVTRSKIDVSFGIIKSSGVRRAVFNLEVETEGISTRVCQVTKHETHPGTIE